MRKMKGSRLWKRILSVVLTLGMVLAMLPFAEYPMVAQAAEESGDITVSYDRNGVKKRVRGVLDELNELIGDKTPGDFKAAWTKAKQDGKLGTVERPFLILEIVPSYDLAEIGYFVEGCEPIRLEDLCGTNIIGGISYTGCVSSEQSTAGWSSDAPACFFPDEPEGKREYYFSGNDVYVMMNTTEYDGRQKTDEIQFKGYYERVADGEGIFVIEDVLGADGSTVVGKKIVKVDEGQRVARKANLVWHTQNKNKYNKEELNHLTYYASLETMSADAAAVVVDGLTKIGQRFYTVRKSGPADPYMDMGQKYYHYQTEDVFVTDTIGLSPDEAEKYSVYVKTITPSELNSNLAWIDYADLVYINAKTHDGTFQKNWSALVNGIPANRLKKTLTGTAPTGFINNDISWDAALKLLERVSAAQDFIGLVFDMTIKDSFTTADSTTYYAYDYSYQPMKAADGNKRTITTGATGYKDNVAKLWLMCTTYSPNLVNQLFVKKGLIEKDPSGCAVFKGRESAESMYWSGYSFLLVDPKTDVNTNLYDVANAEIYWENESGKGNNTQEGYLNYVRGHVYTYKGDKAMTQSFKMGTVNVDSKNFSDFEKYVETDSTTRNIWLKNHPGEDYAGVNSTNSAPSAALRFILDLGENNNTYYATDLNVLEIEPSVGLGTDSKPIWSLSEVEVRKMVPNCTGSVSIQSMTMSSFIGRTDDLNSTYDMIYFGDDDNGFWKAKKDGYWDAERAVWVPEEWRTDFYDSALDGKIYFHMGDLMYAGGRWSWSGDGIIGIMSAKFDGDGSEELRFPGNDLTLLKKAELEEYLAGGLPVIYSSKLIDTGYVLSNTNVYKFLTDGINGNKTVYTPDKVREIDQCVKGNHIEAKITNWPQEYRENAGGATYLPGRTLQYEIDAPSDYRFALYVDLNRNGKFEEDSETVYTNSLSTLEDVPGMPGRKKLSYTVTEGMVGLLQWRLKVYSPVNSSVQISKEGCSAIKRQGTEEKKEIHVLQIIPDTGTLTVDLTSDNYKALYDSSLPQMDAFEVDVTKITWNTFSALFEGENFGFNMGAAISGSNPSQAVLNTIQNKTVVGIGESEPKKLKHFNMIIIGFADTYGGQDLTNLNGEVEYLYYYAMSGKSILFTHDNSSPYSMAENAKRMFGYTANTLLRDIMGMNRYKSLSKELATHPDWLSTIGEEGKRTSTGTKLEDDMEKYQKNRSYDVLDDYGYKQRHGYTYFALKRMGMGSNVSGTRVPYRYVIENPEDSSYVSGYTEWASEGVEDAEKTEYARKTGFTSENGVTHTAVRLNKGQITQYPYNITETLEVAGTHGQWYQANVEDPEVTVWYTLEDPKAYGTANWWEGRETLFWGASPQDAANNYYIYSKGNVFYTGVGHSGNQPEMERKLFVNTMIAAFRATYEAPDIVITNPEASYSSSANRYSFNFFQEYNYGSAGSDPSVSILGESADFSEKKVYFKLEDYSFSNSIKCRIYAEGSSDPKAAAVEYKIYSRDEKDDTGKDKCITDVKGKDEDNYTLGLENRKEYYIVYKLSDMESKPDLVFEAQNDKVDDVGVTNASFLSQPLFKLD